MMHATQTCGPAAEGHRMLGAADSAPSADESADALIIDVQQLGTTLSIL